MQWSERDLHADAALLEKAGADLLFAPQHDAIYPADFTTTVDVGEMGRRYEGAVRPTHFCGVATVVAKLLHLTQPDALYLGQKDAQQTAVLRKLVRDLAFSVQVRIVPISDKFLEYAQSIEDKLRDLLVRTELDSSADTTGKKIRNAAMSKTPIVLVIGGREQEQGSVTVRRYGIEKQESMALSAFIEMLTSEIAARRHVKPA